MTCLACGGTTGSFYCRVFIDGAELGEHRAGGYQPFDFIIPPSTNQTRLLTVVVNNEFNFTTAPTHTGGDFYMFGGAV
jgi:beta-glucuronidase